MPANQCNANDERIGEREDDNRSNSNQMEGKESIQIELGHVPSICQTTMELLYIVLNTCGVITK